MKYYSRKILEQYLKNTRFNKILDIMNEEPLDESINVRRCRDCEYFIRDHPTIDTDGDFGYCEYRTDFNTLEETWPIHWYFTDINGFCREDDIE